MNSKRKRGLKDLFSFPLFEDFDSLFSELEKDFRSFGGYSISVVSTPEGTKVHVKADENVDVAKLRRELEEQYPGAIITIEGGKPILEEVEEEEDLEEKPAKQDAAEEASIISDLLGDRKPLIKEEKEEKK
ncbi:MAG TPA: hypothetical protein ENG81_04165 [Candidatus Bathyarchaeota archaeon]|nr:hypothetical protein [Candidatus Bathyarchaeota archaeon]